MLPLETITIFLTIPHNLKLKKIQIVTTMFGEEGGETVIGLGEE